MFLLRGIEFSLRGGSEAKFTPLLIDNLRRRRGDGCTGRLTALARRST
jgi:hypothetical protein